MIKHNIEPLSKVMEKLRKRGYTLDFILEKNELSSSDRTVDSRKYSPKQLRIDNEYRFEGESNPSDLSILYAISTENGTKGLVVNSYGAQADLDLNEFIKNIDKHNKGSKD